MDALDLVGTTLEGKYAVRSVVGEGGFAVVYRGVHELWNVPVAIKAFKVPLDSLSGDSRARLLDAFVQEGRILSELSERCDAICQARDIGTVTLPGGEWIPYLVLEWLEGEALDVEMQSEWMMGVTPRSVSAAVKLLHPMVEALAWAHTRGISHLDVKPANLFALKTPRGEIDVVKLLDFGIAKVLRRPLVGATAKSRSELPSFTPEYGAPEQFDPSLGPTGPWTDVYALALILVELLSGRPALEGNTREELAAAATDHLGPPTPRARKARVSGEIESVFWRALSVSPKKRYAGAGAFWRALRGAAALDCARLLSNHDRRSHATKPKGTQPSNGPVQQWF